MRYMVFNSEGAALSAEKNILKMWSVHLDKVGGYDIDSEFAVSSGFRNGSKVKAATAHWSLPREVVEGWAIAHPDTAGEYADGTAFNMEAITNFDRAELARLGIPNPKAFGNYVEADVVTEIYDGPVL